MQYNLYDTIWISGFLVPREFVANVSLSQLETILGYRKGRFSKGALIAELAEIPSMTDIDYYGDTRHGENNFNKHKTEKLSRAELNKAAYEYLKKSETRLLKIIPFNPAEKNLSDEENYPAGQGGMQWRLQTGIKKRATVIDLVQGYPYASLLA